MQSPKKLVVAAAPALVGLAGLFVISVLLFAPVSNANRQTVQPAQTAAKATKRPRAEIVPGEVLVRFKEDKTIEGSVHLTVPNKVRGTQRPEGATEQVALRVDRFEGSNLIPGLRIAHASAADTWKAIAALRARADVLYAEPNYLRHADNTPNDPSFSSLYGMTKIAAPQAWDLTTGSNSIVVGVVDEGIQLDHTDLQVNIWTNPSPGSIPGISGDLHGYDFINNSGTIPPEGHATHVAGTIGAVGNNGTGVVGVNWQSSLMSLRFIDESANSGSDADAIRALNYAKQMRDLWISSNHAQGANVRVLNNSYGGAAFSQSFLDAINALNQSDILFVAAAGNNGTNNDTLPHYPSSFSAPNVIGVAATDSSDSRANFSNYGSHSVLLGAPGVGILSTLPSNTYGNLSGTSMATPHVAGAAALLLAANPNLSVNQLRALLAYNGDVVASLQGKTVTGRRLNVFKSLQALNENDTTPPGTVGSFQITSQSGRTINLSWTASGDDGATGQASLYEISLVDGSTSAVLPLTNMTPATSGTLQNASVTIPYRHPSGTIKLREFDNVGNEGTPSTIPASVPLLIADPYVPSTAAPAALSTGGTAMVMHCDDCLKNRLLPFTFPFFGTSYNSVTVSSNGNIYFVPPAPPTRGNGDADDVPGLTAGLARFRMIAGMWDDLDLRTSRRADADVFVVQPDSTHVIFRWQGVQFGDGVNGDPINFEIELSADGTIKTRYGSGNTNLLPVVGISGGEPDAYVVDALTSEQIPISLTNASGAIFTPRILSSGCPASFTVNSNADASDAAPGDGVCATAGSVCTLRAAIEEANMLTCGPIDINFSGVTSPITLNSELPAINHNVNINGPSSSLLTVMRSTAAGTADFGILTVNNTTVNISRLTISGGSGDGGGIFLDGGTLTLTNSLISGNTSSFMGGGIFQAGGVIALTNTTVSGNRASFGGGIAISSGSLTLSNSRVIGNLSTSYGSGIFNGNSGTVTLMNSTVSSNLSSIFGGGIYNDNGTTLILTSSTVSGNIANQGGGILNWGTTTLTNSTVSANKASSFGGGLYNGGTLTLTNSTVTGNCSTATGSNCSTVTGNNSTGGGIYNDPGGTALVYLKDTLIANNTAGGTGPDLNGTFNSQDYNFIGNTSGATFTGTIAHNITGANPLLGPLQNNGGPTLTHALLPGSPAIDAGNSALTTDQRGQPRPLDDPIVANAAGGNSSDIGAYESDNVQVTSLADTDDGACTDVGTGNGCTLREAINAANAQTGAEVITFAPALTSGGPATITLFTALPNIMSDLTITGPGANLLTIQRSISPGTPQFRIFTIQPVTVFMSGLTVTNGRAPDGMNGSAGSSGGGISNSGALSLAGVVVSGNRAGNGDTAGPGCGGGRGGGVFSALGSLTVTSSTISNNTAGDNGGAGCDPGGDGGGIYLFSGLTTIINSTVSGNRVGSSVAGIGGNGGGIYDNQSSLILTNDTIANNQADTGKGGGVRNPVSNINVGNSIIANNSAAIGPDFSGTMKSNDYNLIRITADAFITGLTTHNITGQDPLLGSLQNNGGSTQTHALLPGSPAIDAGNSSLTTDQRGQARPIDDPLVANVAGGNGSDIGAYESHNLQVNSLADTDDSNCTDLGTGNGCTLREAITAANAQSGAEVITFAPALTAGGPATITLLNALPSLLSDMTIAGPGADLLAVKRSTAGGTPNFRIFDINSQSRSTVTISGLTMSHGHIDGGPNPVDDGGAIFNAGTLYLTNSRLNDSTSTFGGGIENTGGLVLTGTTVAGNTSTDGGGIENRGTLTLINSTVTGNTSITEGGGIYNLGTLTLTSSTVSGNTSDQAGGIHNSGTLILTSSTVNGNSCNHFAGGVLNIGTATLANSTISDNSGAGGGIYNGSFATSFMLSDSTVSNNRSSGGGGGILNDGVTFSIKNTIVAGNTSADLIGTFNSQDYNLIGNTSGASFTGTTTHNITNVNARLGPLANNGGLTQTHALLPGSPAIDAGDNSAVNPPFTDQRGEGFNRIADGDGNGTATVDIGAYELQGVLTIDRASPLAGRTSGGQQITLYGAFANLFTVTIGGNSASWSYTNGGDISSITVTTPAHAVGAVQITLTPTTGSPYSKANAFAYLPTVFTDDTIVVGQTTAKAQHIIELRQAVDALRAVAGLSGAPWTDPALAPGGLIKATHIIELRMYLDDAATRLGYSTSSYTDPGLTFGFMIKRIHVEELRQRIRVIAG
jgi:CSLREA domain-containing protein